VFYCSWTVNDTRPSATSLLIQMMPVNLQTSHDSIVCAATGATLPL
jgi:hypothetical protein